MGTKTPRPCLDCGTLTPATTRCQQCQRQRERGRVRPHYTGNYRARAKQVREAPGPCWICHEESLQPGDIWTADHLIPGEPTSPLAKAHRSCNSRRGATPLPPADPGVGPKLERNAG